MYYLYFIVFEVKYQYNGKINYVHPVSPYTYTYYVQCTLHSLENLELVGGGEGLHFSTR